MISNKMITDSQDKNLTPALSSREGERGRRIASGRINIETDAEGWRGIAITDVTESPGVRIVHPYFFIPRLCPQHIQRAGAGRHQNGELGRRLTGPCKDEGSKRHKSTREEVFVFSLVHGGLFGFMGRGWGFDDPAEEEWKTEGWLRWQASRRGAKGAERLGRWIRPEEPGAVPLGQTRRQGKSKEDKWSWNKLI